MGETRRLVSPARVFARPTAEQIWLGPTQQSALSQLSPPARLRVLCGPPSSGKSVLLGHLASRLGEGAVVLSCRGPKDSAGSVLATLLLAADLPCWNLSEVEQRNLLCVFVQQRRSQGRRVLLVIDDAHTFRREAWEEIERLMALKIDRQPAFDLLLAGPSHFASELEPAALGVAPTLGYQLPTPSRTELTSYLEWRLARFHLNDIVTPMAGQMAARLSGGRYGAIDVLAQMALLLARQRRLERIDARLMRQAVATLAARRSAKLEPQSNGDHRPKAPPQGHLLISRGGKLIKRVPLGQRALIGRSEHNDVCLPSPYLSRHHAVIVGTPDGYYVMDLNSINGLSLNGKRVELAVLCDQDLLAIGPFRLKVQVPEWLADGNPLPESDSLADTAIMPAHGTETFASVWRVK
jgi:type II secretory pathway predicted ATPase ExeA